MFLDINEILRSGKDEQDFFFTYSPEGELVDIPNAELCLPVSITGKAVLTGRHSLAVSGEVVFKVSGECTRCLEKTEREFVVEFSEECTEDGESGYAVVNDRVDLGKIVDDTIAMNIPVSFLCKDDCKGLCAGCGANLNIEPCKCSK